MKKILFAAYSMDIGGIETALVTLLNYLAKEEDYEITLVLEKKQGVFLNEISNKIKLIEYSPKYSKNIIWAKCCNMFKRAIFISKYKNKFDCSFSFATYSLSSSFIARTASRNCNLWVHNNYMKFFEDDLAKYKNFFEGIKAKEFRKIIFVSNESKDEFKNIDPELKEKLLVCNNLINYQKILDLADGAEHEDENYNKARSDKENYNEPDEKIKTNNIDRDKDAEVNVAKASATEKSENVAKVPVFLSIGRHEEKQKKLSRLIEACKKLNENGLKYKVIFVGDGPEHQMYVNMIKEYKLEQNFEIIGSTKNPYPYYKQADYVVMTSDFEGYPVVYVESMVFNKPIITTDVSDSKIDIEGKCGLVCKKDVNDIYEKMKSVIEHGYIIKNKFDAKKYNENIMDRIMDIIGE